MEYAGQGDVFEGLSIWKEEKYRRMQGTYPVLMISFASVKETTYLNARKKICHIITELYNRFDFLLDSDVLNGSEKDYYRKVSADMEVCTATEALRAMSGFLMRYYGKKAVILLDEYDTPLQEAYIHGYWNEMADFTRGLFNAAFKTNIMDCSGSDGGITGQLCDFLQPGERVRQVRHYAGTQRKRDKIWLRVWGKQGTDWNDVRRNLYEYRNTM